MKSYSAPWGKILTIVSALMVILALCTAFSSSFLPLAFPSWGLHLIRWALPAIVIACLPFVIRSYTIVGNELQIRRLFWDTRLNLTELRSATFSPKAINKSLRLCGNGGVFSFTGWYWNSTLGIHRAFVTDPDRTVILRFKNKTVVVSPDNPSGFVEEINP
ncbi:MAG: PH domain-containing protein [Luteolibacter sp.]